MQPEGKKLPGVLMLILSALGILISLFIAAGVAFSLSSLRSIFSSPLEMMPAASAGALALLIGVLQIPTLVLAVNSLRGKPTPLKYPSLYKPASLAMIGSVIILLVGVLAIHVQAAWYIFVPLTLLLVAIPVWWIVEFSRRGLPRSTALREWGTLTIGLTAAPLIIMVVELSMVVIAALVVLAVLISQPALMEQLAESAQNLDLNQGGIEQLEQVLMEMAHNPAIASALFLMIGVLAPFVEELFKPMAIWFLLKRPLKDNEGFSLGLISGGAFALIESAGLISQIGLDTWVQAVVLRAGTGFLHIGLSGLVGYGLVSSWNQKRFGHSLLYLFGAAGLHGLWNSLALLNGFYSPNSSLTEFQPTAGSILSVIGMIAVFVALLIIVLHINKILHQSMTIEENQVSLDAPSLLE